MSLEGWEQRHRSENEPAAPIPFVAEIAGALRPGKALDLACGTGRNAIWLAQHGWSVTAVDGSRSAIEILRTRAESAGVNVETRLADLEKHEFTIVPEAWDLIVISLYLQRDLFEPAKLGLKPGGILIAITLLAEPGGREARYRLQPGELAGYFEGWRMLHSSEENGQARIAACVAGCQPAADC